MEIPEIDSTQRPDLYTRMIIHHMEEVFGVANPHSYIEERNRGGSMRKHPDDYVFPALETHISELEKRLETIKEMVELANKFGILPQDVPELIKKMTEADNQTGYSSAYAGRGRDTGVSPDEEARNERILPHAQAALCRLVNPLLHELREKRKQLNEQLKVESNKPKESEQARKTREETHRLAIETTERHTADRIKDLDKIGR